MLYTTRGPGQIEVAGDQTTHRRRAPACTPYIARIELLAAFLDHQFYRGGHELSGPLVNMRPYNFSEGLACF